MPSLLSTLPRPAPRLVAAAIAFLGLLVGASSAQGAPPADAWPVVPPSLVRVSADAVTVQAFGAEVSYLPGLGWTSGWTVPGPVVADDGRVRLAPEAAEALRLPHLAGVRTGLGGATTRLVLDFGALDADRLEPLRQGATIGPDRPLELALPGVLVPDGPILEANGVRAWALPADDRRPARIRIDAAPADAEVFPLADPTRLVVDLVPAAPGLPGTVPAPGAATGPRASDAPDRAPVAARDAAPGAARDVGPDAGPSDVVREVATGVTYRRLAADAASGPTDVHVVELDPDAVELRVVGSNGEGRTVAEWSSGAVAAINAGYFDPGTFEAIGLRRIGGTVTSWPSRGRAAVGFGPAGTVVARAAATVDVRVDGRVVVTERVGAERPLAWSDVPGDRVGDPRHGVLVVDATGRVVRNVVGPVRVPDGGAALSYRPDLRPLAWVEPGQRVTVDARLHPTALDRARWAVEAGPLLVLDGRPAFEPELEAFARGQRILDEATQQAALGVRPDGTVLLVVAERMVASDLVPLFARLGAEAALRLDSGSSATLVADGRTVNRLFARQVESAIVAVPIVEARADR